MHKYGLMFSVQGESDAKPPPTNSKLYPNPNHANNNHYPNYIPYLTRLLWYDLPTFPNKF